MLLIEGALEYIREKFARRLVNDSPVRRLGWFLVFWLLFTALISNNLLPERLKLEEGMPSPKRILAEKETINRVETERLKREAAAQVPEVYKQDPVIAEEAQKNLDKALTELVKIKTDPDTDLSQKLLRLKAQMGIDLPDEVWRAFLESDDSKLALLQGKAKALLDSMMKSGVKKENLELARAQAESEAEKMDLDLASRLFVAGLVKNFVVPNLVVDQVATQQQRQAAMDEVQPVKIPKGLKIIDKDDLVTREHLVILQDLGVLGTEGSFRTWAGSAVVSLVLLAAVALYLYQFKRELFASESKIVLIGLVGTLTLLLCGMAKFWSGYLMPVAAGTMLLAVLIDAQLALVMGAVLAAMAGVITGNELRYAVVALLGGSAGVYAVSRVAQRSDLMRAGVAVGVVNAAAVFGISLILDASYYETAAWQDHMWSLINGPFSAVLTIGLLPFFESIFGVVTSVKLLELSNPNQPLLRKLLVEAPGTYHHSIIVANLAEAATEAVGGDSLLARVGAYYHDVGKTKRPYFFIDNQIGTENPHEKLSPNLSALIVMSHVKDGVELAREYRLPVPVIPFITEHHGTTLMSYFYAKATGNGKDTSSVNENDFRYDGPKPQSKETAIVMLADSCEATVRSMNNPNPGRIEGTVRKIIKERLGDGQLDRSDLTLKDLDTIATTFSRVLSGIFHPRIEYPEGVLKEMEGRKKGGNGAGQPPREGQAGQPVEVPSQGNGRTAS